MNIKEIRLRLGLTQEQFAHLLGVTMITVSRWEREVSNPSPLAREKLKELLKEHSPYWDKEKEGGKMKTTEEQLKEMTENALILYEACKEALDKSHNPVVKKILMEAMEKTK